jgi:hypothetical protein
MIKSIYVGCIYPEDVGAGILFKESIGIFNGNLRFSVRLSASLEDDQRKMA